MSVGLTSSATAVNRVLVIGVYLADQNNSVEHIVTTIGRSDDWTVDQRWAAIGRTVFSDAVGAATAKRVASVVPKFTLLNELLSGISIDDYSYVVVCDDDVLLPEKFLDRYLSIVRDFDLALSQPARTHASYIDHAFVEQLDGLIVRETRFVEIGPVFCIRCDATNLVLPFDERSPMGWGYDLVWPCILENAHLRLGIVDEVPIAHSLRKPVSHYDHAVADAQMTRYLQEQPHLSKHDAFYIVNAYA